MPKKKDSRKRYFSLIFVPDQERDPKSISMSYAKGRLIGGIACFLLIHIILGGFGYVRLIKTEKIANVLRNENIELKEDNRKIEQIIKDFQEVQITRDKITQALGGSLGLDGQSARALEGISIPIQTQRTVRSQQNADIPAAGLNEETLRTHLDFLTEKDDEYFNPDDVPTLLPVKGYLTTHFQKGGWFARRNHFGIDIAARKGTIIKAAGSGVVLISNWTPDFGNVVVIAHGRGLFTYYAHAMRLLVEQGQQVRKGQSIALLGSSGKSSAPHLHFEIWRNGEPIDPEAFLYATQSRSASGG